MSLQFVFMTLRRKKAITEIFLMVISHRSVELTLQYSRLPLHCPTVFHFSLLFANVSFVKERPQVIPVMEFASQLNVRMAIRNEIFHLVCIPTINFQGKALIYDMNYVFVGFMGTVPH